MQDDQWIRLDAQPESGADTRGDTTRVVIADDKAEIRDFIEFNLENEGFDVAAFENGVDCWTHLEWFGPPDAVVLDIMMPGMDGFEVLQRIRETDRLAAVPVLLLTSRGREEDVARGFDAGATYYMAKPFRLQDLRSRLRSVVD